MILLINFDNTGFFFREINLFAIPIIYKRCLYMIDTTLKDKLGDLEKI